MCGCNNNYWQKFYILRQYYICSIWLLW